MLKDTPLRYSEPQLSALLSYARQYQYLTHNGRLDVSSLNRQLFPGAAKFKAQAV